MRGRRARGGWFGRGPGDQELAARPVFVGPGVFDVFAGRQHDGVVGVLRARLVLLGAVFGAGVAG